MAVHPAAQRQGIGRRLMALAEQEARRRGLAEVRLYTHEVMHGALALYRALGYEETERRLEDGYARVYLRSHPGLVSDELPARDVREEASSMTVLVTGSAGFIGYHVSAALLARGEPVLGVDNLNSYYDPALKQARLERLQALPGFAFERADVADRAAMTALARRDARNDPRAWSISPRRPACAIRSRRRSTTCRATSWATW